MSKQGKHISFFEEAVRILNLKKERFSEPGSIHFPAFDSELKPGKEKSQKLINELTLYQSKINKKKWQKWVSYSILLSTIIILSALLLFKNTDRIEEIQQTSRINNKTCEAVSYDSIITTDSSKKHLLKPIDVNNSMVENTIQHKNKVVEIIVVDTIHTLIQKSDTLFNTVTITDTVRIKHLETEIISKTPCSFPKKFRIKFNSNTTLMVEGYTIDIEAIANSIKNCQNLRQIELTGYYSRRFIFFKNKNVVLACIENLQSELRKQGVSIRALNKMDLKLAQAGKNNKNNTYQLIEIRLSDK